MSDDATDDEVSLKSLMEAYNALRSDVAGLAGAVHQDMEKVNFLLFHLLKDLGKVEETTCPNCSEKLVLPKFDCAELDEVCNLCGWTPDNPTLDDFSEDGGEEE